MDLVALPNFVIYRKQPVLEKYRTSPTPEAGENPCIFQDLFLKHQYMKG